MYKIYNNASQSQPDNSRKTICVATIYKDAYSETFIHAHVKRLPANVRVLYGGTPPRYADDKRPLFQSMGFMKKLIAGTRMIAQRLPRTYLYEAALRDFLARNRIRAVLAEYGPTGVALMNSCAAQNVPLLVHFHGYDAYRSSTLAQYAKQYPVLFETCSALIAPSESMVKQLINLGAPATKIYRNPYGVDTSVFQPQRPTKASARFLAIGRFVEKKAPYLTLLAFSQMVKEFPEAQLVMAGDGPLWETCCRLAESMGLHEQVTFPGICSPTEIRELMKQSRAFVQHSLQAFDGDSESFGVVFVEAGASGLPVIATRHDGIPEVVIDGQTGILVEEGDVEGMAQAMLSLARDPDLAGQLGNQARLRICAEFTLEKSIGGLWQIIQTAIGPN